MPPVPHPLRCGLAFLALIAVAANPLRIHSQEALTPASEPVEPASGQQPIQSESTSPSSDLRQPNSVDFNRHIQPILAEHCFSATAPMQTSAQPTCDWTSKPTPNVPRSESVWLPKAPWSIALSRPTRMRVCLPHRPAKHSPQTKATSQTLDR